MDDTGKKTLAADGQIDPFCPLQIFPEAAAIFSFGLKPLTEVSRGGLVVLDTNALLFPYATSKQSLETIKKTYRKLAVEKRLVIPGQVAREFAKHRSEKLKQLFAQLSKKSELSLGHGNYPLLEGVPEYQKLLDIESELGDRIKGYRDQVDVLLQKVRAWRWDDPVSVFYRELFSSEIVYDPPFDPAEVSKSKAYRYAHKIPPGYKDAGKPDGGIGDYMIWRTILALGSERQRDVLFVTGEEKTDWWDRECSQALFPRFELVDEFRRASNGSSFHVIGLSAFLELTGAEPRVVEEARNQEASPAWIYASLSSPYLPVRYAAVHAWLQRQFGDVITFGDTDGPIFRIAGQTGLTDVFVFEVSALVPFDTGPAIGLLNRWRGGSRLSELMFVFVGSDEGVFMRSSEFQLLRGQLRGNPSVVLVTGLIGPRGEFVPSLC